MDFEKDVNDVLFVLVVSSILHIRVLCIIMYKIILYELVSILMCNWVQTNTLNIFTLVY